MANDDSKPGDPFHSGHTVMLGAELPEESGPAAPQQTGPSAGGHYSPTQWGAKTMALPIEAFDGLEGMPTGAGGGGGGGGAPAGGSSGKTMALPVDPSAGPPAAQASPPQGGTPYASAPAGGYGEPPQMPDPYGGDSGGGGGYGGAPSGGDGGGGGGGGGGGIPYAQTQAIEAPSEGFYQQQQQPQQSTPSFPDPSMDDEPVKTTLLDPSKIDMSAFGGAPAGGGFGGAPQQPQYGQPPPQPAAPPDSFDSSGMAQGQKTVILRPEAAEAAMAQLESAKAQTLPPSLKGHLIIFVPDTDPIQFELMPGITTVGRGMENHLVLGDPYASRKHMVLTNNQGQYVFEDTGSDNGTTVNGGRCATKNLEIGDVIEIGSVKMRFVMGDVMPQHFTRPADGPPPKKGKLAKRKKKKKSSKTQLILLIFLVIATLGMVGVMVMLFLQRQGG